MRNWFRYLFLAVAIAISVECVVELYYQHRVGEHLKTFVGVTFEPPKDCLVVINGKPAASRKMYLSNKFTFTIEFVRDGEVIKRIEDYHPVGGDVVR